MLTLFSQRICDFEAHILIITHALCVLYRKTTKEKLNFSPNIHILNQRSKKIIFFTQNI